MREELLGLELDRALEMLRACGVVPEVIQTCAPKKAERNGVLRVVYTSDDGGKLIVSRFVDPIADE